LISAEPIEIVEDDHYALPDVGERLLHRSTEGLDALGLAAEYVGRFFRDLSGPADDASRRAYDGHDRAKDRGEVPHGSDEPPVLLQDRCRLAEGLVLALDEARGDVAEEVLDELLRAGEVPRIEVNDLNGAGLVVQRLADHVEDRRLPAAPWPHDCHDG